MRGHDININIEHLHLNYGHSQSVSGAGLIVGQHEYCAQMVHVSGQWAEGRGRGVRVLLPFSLDHF